MAYSNVPIGTSNPGCIVILVDQSWSMNGEWQTGIKAEQAALIVNRAIYNLALKCQQGTEIKQRCYVSVISYGESVNSVVEGMIADVYASPIEVKTVARKIPDGAGGLWRLNWNCQYGYNLARAEVLRCMMLLNVLLKMSAIGFLTGPTVFPQL